MPAHLTEHAAAGWPSRAELGPHESRTPSVQRPVRTPDGSPVHCGIAATCGSRICTHARSHLECADRLGELVTLVQQKRQRLLVECRVRLECHRPAHRIRRNRHGYPGGRRAGSTRAANRARSPREGRGPLLACSRCGTHSTPARAHRRVLLLYGMGKPARRAGRDGEERAAPGEESRGLVQGA